MSKKEFDGITVGGKSVESYLMEDSDKEIGEVIENTRKVSIKKRRLKYMETKEPNGKVTNVPQHEINHINLEANIKKAKTRIERVLAHLLSGETITAKRLVEIMQVNPTDAATLLRTIYKSNLGEFVLRGGNASKGYEYSMIEAGRNLLPEQAYEILKSKKTAKLREGMDIKMPEQEEVHTPIQHTREPLDINLNISGGIQITFAFKLER